MKPPNENSIADLPEDLKEQIEAFEKFCEVGEREMSATWRNQSFQSLMRVWENTEGDWDSGYEMMALRNRFEAIMGMMERNRVWPPPVSPWSHRFRAALREALSRLPQEVFDKTENDIRFVLEELSIKLVPVDTPAPPPAPLHTLVFSRACMKLAPKDLVDLIAHGIARAFVRGQDCRADESLAENKAREWGFGAASNTSLLEIENQQKVLKLNNSDCIPI